MSPRIVSFNCLLKNTDGKLVGSSEGREVLMSLSGDGPMQKLSEEMRDLKMGQKRTISLTADQAYGPHDPRKVIMYPQKKMPDPRGVRTGQTVSLTTKSGLTNRYLVMQINGDMVTLDGNHPLAGQDLVFEIEMTSARIATADEVGEARNPLSKLVFN